MGDIRIFLDANALVSGIVFYGNEHTLLTKSKAKVTLITSEDAVDETKRVLTKKFPDEIKLVDTFLQLLDLHIIKRNKYSRKIQNCTVVRDAKDKHILVAAVEAHADYIVTGDDDLLTIKRYEKIAIIRAKEALALFS